MPFTTVLLHRHNLRQPQEIQIHLPLCVPPPYSQIHSGSRLASQASWGQERQYTWLMQCKPGNTALMSDKRGFFLAKRVRGSNGPDETPKTPLDEFGYTWAIARLEAFEKGFFNETAKEDRFICFGDPSTYDENPGWPLRNLLVLIRQRWNLYEAQILCYRDTHQRRDQSNSLILQIQSDPSSDTAPASDGSSARPRTPEATKSYRMGADRKR